ncbi:hypothetical protein ABZ345_42795 [Lentzea sp. NPDC005914]|uniref:hypothetical protein n=1 Tax=Lentzea sp. NPDC005914 TaxID=3154572 RepID=UPI0033FEB383
MRIFTQIGVTLLAVVALAATTTGVASASTGYAVNVFHSSGVLAASGNGNFAWSTSRRTVSVTTPSLSATAGEWADVTLTGRQGNKAVTGQVWAQADQRGKGSTVVQMKPFSLTTSTPGGIEFVRITVRDIDHQIVRTVDCYYYETSCP